MSCKDKWAEEVAARLQAQARIAPGQVDGGQRCDHEGCTSLVNLATSRCVEHYHVQGGDSARQTPAELDGLWCAITELSQQEPGVAADDRVVAARRFYVEDMAPGEERSRDWEQGCAHLRALLEVIGEAGDQATWRSDPRIQAAQLALNITPDSPVVVRVRELLEEEGLLRESGEVYTPDTGDVQAFWTRVLWAVREHLPPIPLELGVGRYGSEAHTGDDGYTEVRIGTTVYREPGNPQSAKLLVDILHTGTEPPDEWEWPQVVTATESLLVAAQEQVARILTWPQRAHRDKERAAEADDFAGAVHEALVAAGVDMGDGENPQDPITAIGILGTRLGQTQKALRQLRAAAERVCDPTRSMEGHPYTSSVEALRSLLARLPGSLLPAQGGPASVEDVLAHEGIAATGEQVAHLEQRVEAGAAFVVGLEQLRLAERRGQLGGSALLDRLLALREQQHQATALTPEEHPAEPPSQMDWPWEAVVRRAIDERVETETGEPGPRFGWLAAANETVGQVWLDQVQGDAACFPTAELRERAAAVGMPCARYASRKVVVDWLRAPAARSAHHMLLRELGRSHRTTLTAPGRDGQERTWREGDPVEWVEAGRHLHGTIERCGFGVVRNGVLLQERPAGEDRWAEADELHPTATVAVRDASRRRADGLGQIVNVTTVLLSEVSMQDMAPA